MPNQTIQKNPYGILGVKSSTPLNKIRKKSRVLCKYLSMERDLDVDLDFDIYKKIRTEKLVKKASEELAHPKKNLISTFFWFNFVEEVDEKAFKLIKKGKKEKAIELWEKEVSSNNGSTLIEKNLALFYSLCLFEKKNKNYLRNSLELWENILDSSRFWKAFIRFYELYDEVGTSKETINDFKENASEYVSDLYAELYKYHNEDLLFLRESSKIFSKIGEKSKKEILEPVYINILENVKKIKEITEDEVVKGKLKELKKLAKEIQDEFIKIKDFNKSTEELKIKNIKDKASREIRSVGLILHNKHKKSDEAVFFIELALNLVTDNYLKKQLQKDLKTVQNFAKLGPIGDLLEKGKDKKALKKIRKKKKKTSDKKEIKFLENYEKIPVLNLALKKHNEALSLGMNALRRSRRLLNKSATIICENIDIFDFDKIELNKFISKVKNRSKELNYNNRRNVELTRKDFISKAGKIFNKEEEQAIIILINYYIYGSLSTYLKNQNRDKAIAWFSFVTFLFFISYEPLVGLIAIILTIYFGLRNQRSDVKDLPNLARRCARCNNEVDSSDKFCTNCGKELD